MKAEDFLYVEAFHNGNPCAVGDDDYIKCRYCGDLAHPSEWTEMWVQCEECGEHLAMKCPCCSECTDLIIYSVTVVREADLDGLDFFKKKEEGK